ncbi:MAG: hypothetical protein HY725_07800 [Candidatus Rokubacteria bacterium]|nr:hypothetical protein [Candidatus Rokubacteria bacterium]
MDETRSPDEIPELLRASYAHALSGTIAIDGTDGAGKTTLAVALQAAVGGTVVSLDGFVPENRGGYVPYLRTAELKAALETSSQPCIVEGICVLAALARVSHKPDVLIYVKRLASYGYWHDEVTCDPTEPVDELVSRLAEEVALLARFDAERSGEPLPEGEKPGLTPLREEVIRYHALYRPSRRADIIFLRGCEDA